MFGWGFEPSKFDMQVKVGELSEDGTSALLFKVVGMEGTPGTMFRRSSEVNLVLHSRDKLLPRRRPKEVFLPTNVSVDEFVAATYASSVVCPRDEYNSGTENNDE